MQDIYSYDSGSNASSSRSRGPFVQIRGPRDSPLSVSVVNAPLGGDEDGEKRSIKNKKFHDDSEYRWACYSNQILVSFKKWIISGTRCDLKDFIVVRLVTNMTLKGRMRVGYVRFVSEVRMPVNLQVSIFVMIKKITFWLNVK